MTHLFKDWAQIQLRLREAESVALFLDFDGTLAGLRDRPEAVKLPPRTRRALFRLAHSPRIHAWIVSGRRLDDIRERVRVPGLGYIGLHGAESGGPASLSNASRAGLLEAQRYLTRHLPQAPGVWIEDKGATLAVHYRSARNGSEGKARASVAEIIGALGGALRVIEGDRVSELMPPEVPGKGEAARSRWRKSRGLPIYVGNDGTDEPAFEVLSGGITVRVGPRRRSRARFALRDPREVREFLEKLEETVR
jgi:trehalose 6-phosphate phosphatase